MRRREFLVLGAAGSAAWLAGCEKKKETPAADTAAATTPPPAPKPAPVSQQPTVSSSFRMTVSDGYAYVLMNGRKKLVIGAIDAPDPSGNGNIMKHPILLEVQHGKIRGTSPFPSVPNKPNTFDLTGWHVELDLGKSANALSLPAETWVTPIMCPTTLGAWNNLAWLPDAKKIYGGKPMAADWPKHLTSRFVVSQSDMQVLESAAKGMWSFKDDNMNERLRQPMSAGTEFTQALAASDVVTFNLFKLTDTLPAPGATPTAQLLIDQDSTGVKLIVSNGITGGLPYKIGQPVPHFGRYAALIQGGEHVLPYFEACDDGRKNCPGDFCPYGRFEV